MKILSLLRVSSLLALSAGVLLPPWEVQANSWPSWRGDLAGSGRASDAELPVEWGAEKNVKWRVELPDRGNSTPVVWGEKIFVTQAVEEEHFRGLYCYDRNSGELLWKKGLVYDKEERTHRSNPYASASPATNGEVVVASFGSAGMVAWDLDGEEKWRRDFGPIDHVWGNSSSPVIEGDRVFHYHGPGKGGFLVALDLETGEDVWKFEEPEWEVGERTDGFRGRDDEGVIGSFSTPILVEAGGRRELVMSFPMEMKAFDPASGEVLWTAEGLNPLVYTSPVASGEDVIVLGGYQGNSISVRAGGDGDVTGSRRHWHKVRHNGGIGSGVTRDGHYYYHNSGGIVTCLDVVSGEEKWEARLPGAGKSWGSFVLAGDRIYTLSQAGDTVVFRADPEKFEVLAQADVGEETNSSLVVSNGEIFIRTWESLWCIAEE